MKEFSPKAPSEEFYVAFNFSRRLGAANISSATIVVTDDATSPTDVTDDFTDSTSQNIVTPKVNVWVKAGTAAHRYRLQCDIETSAGETFVLVGYMDVVSE